MRARPKRYSLAIELTSYCNQRCGYCYNGWREDGGRSVGALLREELLALVDRALRELELDHVTLTGGEPFARKDLFDVLDLVARHGKRANIISNGGLVTSALAERLAPYRPYFVQVALNGPSRELHEAHVGEGHFADALRGIERLLAAGVPVSGCIVMTRRNAHHVGATLDLFRSVGVTSVALSRFSPAGFAAGHTAELLCTRSDLIAALEQAEARGRDRGMTLSSTMPIPQCVLEHAAYPHVRFGGCSIGTEMQELALGPQGELRNCTLHAEPIGDARARSFAELVESPAVSRYRAVTPEFCAPCPFVRSCLGGCGAAAAATGGETHGLDPFVAQHVDDAFSARMREERARLIAPESLVR